jgi:plastocyanin
MVNSLVRWTLAATAATALVAVAASVVPQGFAAGTAEIPIVNFTFTPATLTVAPGTAVTWVNNDEEPHNVVSAGQPRVFRSEGIDGGEKYTYVFDKAGTYKYICTIHPRMHGTVVVQ